MVIEGNSTTAATDFMPFEEVRVFTPQIRSRCVPVQLIDDSVPEFQEVFFLVLTTEDNLVLFSTGTFTINIINDDCMYLVTGS